MINVIKDGETYNSMELASVFRFGGKDPHENCKQWITAMGIYHFPVKDLWWCAGEDIRRAMRMGRPTKEDLRGEN